MKNLCYSLVLAVLILSATGAAGTQPGSSAKTPSANLVQPEGTSQDKFVSVVKGGVLGVNHPLPGSPVPPVSPVGPEEVVESNALCLLGEGQAKKGEWATALVNYRQALNLWPQSKNALYGAAECAAGLGDAVSAASYFRSAVYTNDPTRYGLIPGDGFQENNAIRLMQFASLLDKTGQTAEATTIYNRAATLLKYMDDKPSRGYLLPLFGTEQGQISYTSARLQALAQVGLGVDSQDTQELTPAERVVHLKEAARLYPNSPVVQSYLGDVLAGAGDAAGAKAARAQANALGISRVKGLLDAQTAIMQEQKGVK